MKDLSLDVDKYHKSFVETTQILATVTKRKNFWLIVSQIIQKYFKTDFFIFFERQNQDDFSEHYMESIDLERYEKIREKLMGSIRAVMERGIFDTKVVRIPETYFVIVLPVSKVNIIHGVMLIAHKSLTKIPNELLNIYLALGSLIENTLNRIVLIDKLSDENVRLEEMVKERTTELRQVNTNLEREVVEREKMETVLKHFISAVSHELRDYITATVHSLSILNTQSDKLSSKTRIKLMEIVSRNTLLLAELIENLNLIHDINGSKIDLTWVRYNVLNKLTEILELTKPRLLSKELEVELEFEKECYSYGDTKIIGHIFRIFIDNAINYSERNSKIEIHVINRYKGEYNPTSVEGILVQFTDHGRGIKAEDVPKIFNRFFSAETASDVTHDGLGLEIARDLIKLLKGDVFVKSKFGKGSTFSIFLPTLERR